jgi:hypothetical protein
MKPSADLPVDRYATTSAVHLPGPGKNGYMGTVDAFDSSKLIEFFWNEEYHAVAGRRMLNDAVGRTSGSVEYNFNMVDVELDFDTGTATVASILGDVGSQSMQLDAFLTQVEERMPLPPLNWHWRRRPRRRKHIVD